MDRILVEELDGARRRRCVACGHTDTMVTTAGPAEPATRLSRRRARDEPAKVVRIVEPPKVKR
jgi:hypothetical protein